MKKSIIIICITVSLIFSFSLGFLTKKMLDVELDKNIKQQNSQTHIIETNEETCLANVITTSDTINCINKSEKEWDNEISKYISLLNNIANTEESKFLKISQDNWQKQNKSDNDLITLFVKNKGGTMYQQLAASDYSELKKQRAEFLKWLYELQEIEKNY